MKLVKYKYASKQKNLSHFHFYLSCSLRSLGKNKHKPNNFFLMTEANPTFIAISETKLKSKYILNKCKAKLKSNYILNKSHQIPSLKFDALICVHRHAVSPVHFLRHVLRSFIFCFRFSFHYVNLMSNCCFSITCQKVIMGLVDQMTGLSAILHDTAPLFVYTDQLLCHCVFICSNVR